MRTEKDGQDWWRVSAPRIKKFNLDQVSPSGFAVKELSSGVYGLVYPGYFAEPSWCYLTIASDVMIASQSWVAGDVMTPRQSWDKFCGTSITNAWSKRFMKDLSAFLRDYELLRESKVLFFEHLFHRPKDISARTATLEYVWLEAHGEVEWSIVADGVEPVRKEFKGLTGRAMPDFESFGFCDDMARCFREAEEPHRLALEAATLTPERMAKQRELDRKFDEIHKNCFSARKARARNNPTIGGRSTPSRSCNRPEIER